MIAKNGGSIEAENKLTNTGAVIASLNTDEKLKISANEIEVNNLEDKDKYENIGGGISVGFDKGKPKIPNLSVSHDKIDKEQINRATAINTEFIVAGEEKSPEELGFNTDIEKAQENTKDDEKHLNAKLHTDLLNEDERNKLVLAGRKLNTLTETLIDDKEAEKLDVYRAGLRAIHIDELRKEREKEFAFIDDENTTPLDKLRALRDLQAELYKKEGYTGILPELYLTDEPNSFAVDGKDGETRKIFISLNDLKRGNSSALLYAHENAHLVKYDKGEEIAKYAETKIGENNLKNKFTEKEEKEYLSNLRKKIEIDKTLEEQFRLARSIDKKDRENFGMEIFVSETYAFGGRISRTQSLFSLFNKENETLTTYNTGSTSIGFGSLDIGTSIGVGFYYDDTIEDLSKLKVSLGGSISIKKISFGGDLLFKKGSIIPRGLRIYSGKGISPLSLELHTTFIEIGTPQNIKTDKEGYKIFKNFLKNSKENGGEW